MDGTFSIFQTREDVEMQRSLKREVEFFRRNREEYVKNYVGKILAIKNEKILGVFDDYLKAAEKIYPIHKYGTVLMQPVEKKKHPMIVTTHMVT